jgi:hypothetical protein
MYFRRALGQQAVPLAVRERMRKLMRETSRIGAAVVAAALLGVSSAWGQPDAAKALIGTWEGEVRWHGMSGEPGRTLIIESLEEKEGKWVASGRYGITGKGLGRVQIEVNDISARPWIQFTTGAHSRVRLDLSDPKHLTGTLTLAGTSQRGNDRTMKLEKRE